MIKTYYSFIFGANNLFSKFQIRRPCDVCVGKYISSKCSTEECPDPENTDISEEFDFEQNGEAVDSRIEELCANDLKKLAKLKHLRLLVSLLRYNGKEVPQRLTEVQWINLLSYERKRDQVSYLSNLFKRENYRKYSRVVSDIENIKYKKTKQMEHERDPIQITTSGPIIYQLRFNSMFHRVLDPTIDKFYNYKLLQAMMFAPTTIVDCGFEFRMKEREIDVVVTHMVKMWSHNRSHLSPFHVQYCNVNPEGRLIQRIREHLPALDDPAYPFFYTTKSYLELYPPERLVYLSSDAHHELKEFNGDDVYIMGALGNHTADFPSTKLKAQKDGIRAVKFPIKRYNIKLQRTQHSLDLVTVLSILNDVKETNDWRYAFRHLSERKYIVHHREGKVAPDHSLKSRQRLGSTYNLLLAKSL